MFDAKGITLSVCNAKCSWGHSSSSPRLDSHGHLRRPGEARQVRAPALHQAFRRDGLVPGQRSQGRRAPGVHAEERAVSFSSSLLSCAFASTLGSRWLCRASSVLTAGRRTPWAWCHCSTWCTRTASRRRRLPDCRPLARTCWRWENAQPWAEELLMRSSGSIMRRRLFRRCFRSSRRRRKKKKWLPGVIEKIRSECTPQEVKPRSSHLRFPRREVLVSSLRGNGGATPGTHQAWLELTSLRPGSGGKGQGEWQPVNVKR